MSLSSWLYARSAVRFARERLGFEPDPKQREVLEMDKGWGLLNCTRQWGKSTVTAVKALHRTMYEPGSLVLVVTPSDRQSGEFVRKAAGFVAKLGFKVRGDGDNEISLLLPNGSRIVGTPGKESTVRGFSAVSLLLIDEAARVPEELYEAVLPMLGATNGDLWLMSTPHGKRGFFWEEWSQGGNLWARVQVPATECPRIHPGFLERQRQRRPERVFRQEYLCEFTSTDDAVFSEDSIQRALRWDVKALKVPPFEPRATKGI
jgi:hypothetical protein